VFATPIPQRCGHAAPRAGSGRLLSCSARSTLSFNTPQQAAARTCTRRAHGLRQGGDCGSCLYLYRTSRQRHTYARNHLLPQPPPTRTSRRPAPTSRTDFLTFFCGWAPVLERSFFFPLYVLVTLWFRAGFPHWTYWQNYGSRHALPADAARMHKPLFAPACGRTTVDSHSYFYLLRVPVGLSARPLTPSASPVFGPCLHT